MKVCHTVICFVFLSLRDGNTGLLNAETITETEGRNINVKCSFSLSGRRKIFCKEECNDENILVETTGDEARNGRYSIKYEEGIFPAFDTVVHVGITNLTKSDSGRYSCALERRILQTSYDDFEIRVTDAPTTRPTTSTASVPSTSTATTTHSLSSSSGSTQPSEQQQSAAPAGMLLYLGLILGGTILGLLVAVLIFCRKRIRKPKGAPVETEFSDLPEANRVYESIREDRQSRRPPLEVSTVYSYATRTKSERVTEDHSPDTDASSQKQAEGDCTQLDYSVVQFSSRTPVSLNSFADNVVYSVPRVERSSDCSKDASPPLYSTVGLTQQ